MGLSMTRAMKPRTARAPMKVKKRWIVPKPKKSPGAFERKA
jgi:hypothetical protein